MNKCYLKLMILSVVFSSPIFANEPLTSAEVDSISQAVEVRLNSGILGSIHTAIDNLKGEKGDTGPMGPQGPAGVVDQQFIYDTMDSWTFFTTLRGNVSDNTDNIESMSQAFQYYNDENEARKAEIESLTDKSQWLYVKPEISHPAAINACGANLGSGDPLYVPKNQIEIQTGNAYCAQGVHGQPSTYSYECAGVVEVITTLSGNSQTNIRDCNENVGIAWPFATPMNISSAYEHTLIHRTNIVCCESVNIFGD